MKPILYLFILLTVMSGCGPSKDIMVPGMLPDNRVLLPNGWTLSPAGNHVEVGELPLNIALHPDGRYAVVTNNGTRHQGLSVVDLNNMRFVQDIALKNAWLGLKFADKGNTLYASGGTSDVVYVYNFREGSLMPSDSIVIGPPWPERRIWLTGLDVDEQSNRLFVVSRENDQLYCVNLAARTIEKEIRFAAKPYTCLVSQSNNYVYVSLWGGSEVTLIGKGSLEIVASIPVGDHPNDMVETPDGRRLFVANANSNSVSVIDIGRRKVIETLSASLYPAAPAGSTTNSVALNSDGTRLYIANADNNCLAVFDVSQPGHSLSQGFIPVGWYPTCVRVANNSGQIVVANGKGFSSRPNPRGPNPLKGSAEADYTGTMFKGSLSIVKQPTPAELGLYSKSVYANTPYSNEHKLPSGTDTKNPLAASFIGASSPIKHVFYIIKENRTYDQVFGDMKEGNGDANLCLFPDSVTPNHHALARQFVLLDNLYADAEVSADGHNWSMAAYATDYVEKSWPNSYGGHGGDYEFEGGYPIASPTDGYIWDNCARHGISYRSYGEFVENGKSDREPARALTDALAGHIAPYYRGWDTDYSDVQRVNDWITEFDEFVRTGTVPQFQVLRLPNDHTEGTHSGKPTPRAYVAQNDVALGMFADHLSKSSIWKESAVFVIEDDAQNGPDHVDAHRTVALVISPYTRHGVVDHTMYSTSSMVRTMELILGLPPMSQYDAAASPMYNSFTAEPELSPYAVRHPNINLNERNIAGAYGQGKCDGMDFTHEDAAPDIELNEIIWRSVRGGDSPMPAPVRGAFVSERRMDLNDD